MANFVEEQLDSIARQTRLPDELIVCDDGSQDRSMDILRAFAARAPFQVTIIQNERRLGCNRNFEKAISLCRGDIIFLSDHDDVWRPHKIKLLLDLMEDSSVGAAFGNAAVVAADLTPLGFTLWDTCNFNSERRNRFAAGQQFSELIANNVMQGAAAAFRSSFRSSIMPIPMEWQHDYWIALIVSALSRIQFTEEAVLDYRQHGTNLLGAGTPVRIKPPPSRLRRFPRQVGHWFEKIRSPIKYYGRRLAPVVERRQSLSVLRSHLAGLDQESVGAAMEVVSSEIERRRQAQESIEQRMRRWT
jgi:glycosyltransferase involved in cell wall biosynthesis